MGMMHDAAAGLPRFSVAMCVYGKDDPDWFDTALNSVIEQTVTASEIVLVVDGPIPETIQAVIDQYSERTEAFHVIYLPTNQGHGNARRAAIERCSNELVALMDADDISLPTRFEKQLAAFAREPEAAVIGGNIAEFVGGPDNVVGLRTVLQRDGEIKRDMKKRCPMNQMTVMLRKSAVEAVGGYVDWYCDEDYYLWVRLLQGGYVFANVEDILVKVRVGQDMYQRRGGWRYFRSEARLQGYMLKNGVIGLPTYLVNTAKRLVVQVLLPNRVRSWVFQHFARQKG